jgi:mono/diheme cytochrome c family protein
VFHTAVPRLAWLSLAAMVAAGVTGCTSPPPPADPGVGRTLYAINGCPACHGDDGRGDGPLAAISAPRPRDFHRPGEFATARDVDRLAAVIASGLAAMPTPMPGYGHLSEADRRHIAAYVLSLGQASR